MREDYTERIEAFLSGNMGKGEQLAFEQELKSDPELAEEVALQRDTLALLDMGAELDYKEKLQEIDRDLMVSKSRPLFSQTRIWLAAAGIFIGACLITWLMFKPSSSSPYGEAFVPYQDLTGLRGDTLDLFRTGMNAYNRGQYDIGIGYLKDFVEVNPSDLHARLYLGISYLANEEAEKALFPLSQIPDSSILAPTAHWYHALALGQSSQEEKALEVLCKIAGDLDHAYRERALKLLEKLE